MSKVWLVTGASRGLGREIARAALDAGETVVATARSADAVRDAFAGEHHRLHALALDITDARAATSVAAETVERFGAIDVLVNNAGYAELGFFETFTDAAVRRQFEVNLFGTMNVARAVAPHMRQRRSGLIVTISSVSGLVSNGGGAVYSASKFAVEGWMEGFAQELAPMGVRSLLVEPGMLRTEFMDRKSARFGSIDIPDYAEAIAQYRAFVDGANGNQPGDPKLLAARIVALASQGEVPSRLVFGDDARQWAGAKVDQLRQEITRSAERG
ncbi:SDR family NAD(P)-dependent oxidoreductase [Pelagibacterium halotolerans]|uniref:Short-chain dehydrogenase/reductase SDR n=1 Tax=Pelagibacterium halotolerans (strain DSM 22347 / JCM 15775 / CGMCC 1.7692 / B2) TaxID=1082931 RepID=G4RFE9_PELHB|nr:SDR family NAD(P)-dependent oxidoreductase [Pelagibacterium halotolerans]AEQ51987.1 short-chain dehydrogenase/reductase SDR [Pelagibacterium halotolerans B2]QJR18226.1 SDR family NAD(P)-dependent oxidoreductase [Pelagibacterium halotolerans]SDZ81015.1 Short-chain dehydrogenase [Pelagibacterium halotolerans]